MTSQRVDFGSRGAARQVRNNPQLRGFVAEGDDARSSTVRLKSGTPESALNRIGNLAAESRQKDAAKAGQSELSRRERSKIDFSRQGVNVPKARSLKAIAEKEGVSDFLQFADLTLTVDENREVLERASREEKGSRGLGRSSEKDVTMRAAGAFDRQREEEVGHAKGPAFGGDPDAQALLRERQGAGADVFDVSFSSTDRFGRPEPSGRDAERLRDIHSQRSAHAQRMDEIQAAPKTRDPLKWVNNPAQLDFPGIDTVDPERVHSARSDRAQAVDESRTAPMASSVEEWAASPDEFDLEGIDAPAAAGGSDLEIGDVDPDLDSVL